MELPEFRRMMNREHGRLLAHMERKALDYASERDVLADFKEEAAAMDVPVEMIIFTHWQKHVFAVRRWASKGELESETIEERLTDMLGYAYLMSALVKERDADLPSTPD